MSDLADREAASPISHLRLAPPPSPRVVTMRGGLPDHSLDAETAVLSACMLDAKCVALLPYLHAKHFFDPANQHIWSAILALVEAKKPTDSVTVADWLRGQKRLAEVGGIPYIAKVVDCVPYLENVDSYAEIVYQAAQVRSVANACRKTIAEAETGLPNRTQFLSDAEQRICRITQASVHRGAFRSLKDMIRQNADRFAALQRGESVATGLPTGLRAVDALTGGFPVTGKYWVIGARPGMGKSSLACNLANNVAAIGDDAEKAPGVAIFSLEMDEVGISTVLLCSEARVNGNTYLSGKMGLKDWDSITHASTFLSQRPVVVDCTKGLTAFDIRARAIRQKNEFERQGRPIGLVIVDYLQKIHGRSVKGRSRDEEVGEISGVLADLPSKLGCTVIALAQLSRECEAQNRRPAIRDLRESGNIEQDADLIAFIHEQPPTPTGCKSLYVAKHRAGNVGTAFLSWTPECTRFDDYEGHGIGASQWIRNDDPLFDQRQEETPRRGRRSP
jgi:replicative DNA helicase